MTRLLAYRSDLAGRPLPDPPNVNKRLAPFLDGIAELEARGSAVAKAPPTDLIAACRRDWISASPSLELLSRRAVRVLCGDPSTTDDPTFIRALKATGRLRESRWLAERLLDSYDIGWSPTRAKQLAPIIKEAFELHPRRSVKASAFLSTRGLLSDRAPGAIAEIAVADLLDPKDLASRFFLAQDGQLLVAVRASINPVWERRLETTTNAPLRQALFEFGFRFLVEPPAIAAPERAAAVTAIIMATQSADTDAIAWLRSATLKSRHLGDPRKPGNSNNWSLVSAAAVRRFIQWLAKEDLRFFFEAVMENTPDPHGRQAFWSEWLDDARLVDSCVAISAADLSYLRSRGLITPDLLFSRLTSAAENISAFLLRFSTSTGDIVAIEFSQAGNAAYFHEADAFDEHMGGIHRHTFNLVRDLKNKETELDPPPGMGSQWDWHREGWEWHFRRALSYYLR